MGVTKRKESPVAVWLVVHMQLGRRSSAGVTNRNLPTTDNNRLLMHKSKLAPCPNATLNSEDGQRSPLGSVRLLL